MKKLYIVHITDWMNEWCDCYVYDNKEEAIKRQQEINKNGNGEICAFQISALDYYDRYEVQHES